MSKPFSWQTAYAYLCGMVLVIFCIGVLFYMNTRIYLGLFVLVLLVSFHCRKSRNGSSMPGPNPDSSGGTATIKDSVLISGLNFPWEILWGPDNFIWMTERGGKISRLNPVTGALVPIATIPEVVSIGEGGMLGMVLHPDFPTNPSVFVVYDYNSGNGYTEKVVRYNYSGGALSSPVTLIDNIHANSIHNGSRLLILNNQLFITTGDAGDQSQPQNMSVVNGKILRINLDGSIPADNPVPGNPVWSFGHRNPQGLVYANGILYSAEHGQNTDDEINIIEKGRNYGWPNVTGPCDLSEEQSFCSANNVKESIKAWTPTIAPSGLDFYDKAMIPQWKNSLLLATLKNRRLIQLKLDEAHTSIIETHEFFTDKYGRMRDVCISPDGKVYICTSNGGDDKVIVVQASE